MELTLGFSSCPNDTFILDALLHERIPNPGYSWVQHIEDVETLNQWALRGALDITKMSFSTWLRVREDYALLKAGAALGYGCGPLLIARKPLSDAEMIDNSVALPGELTTANMLFALRYPQATKKLFMNFAEIEDAILDGVVSAGVIIHENRFTYAAKGLVKVLDLGEWWETQTGGPVPLGAFGIKRSLGQEMEERISQMIRDSLEYAFADRDTVMPFVRMHAQDMDDAVMNAHIDTYVNAFSLDLGAEGRDAVAALLDKATVSGVL